MLLLCLPLSLASLAAPSAQDPAEGLEHLLTRSYQGFSLTAEEYDRLPTVWSQPQRAEFEALPPEQRRRAVSAHYGLPHPPQRDVPAAFAVGDAGWTMNCLACHQGSVDGQFVPGLGNANLRLADLLYDTGRLWRAAGRDTDAFEGQLGFIPLGGTVGTTNAQAFSAVFAGMRAPDLELNEQPQFTHMISHDLDAPPLWHLRKKQRLYADGYVEKDARVIMQFALGPENDAATLRSWEPDFRAVLAWMESLEAPAWPHALDADLVERGQQVFEASCAECHGTYGDPETYPELRVPLDVVGTDPLRLSGIPPEFRAWVGASWLGHYGELDVETEPDGYLAPPLDGIWASAPYLHNGSVPTLWHLLRPSERPTVWRRSGGYDVARAGMAIETRETLPDGFLAPYERRAWFDTRKLGKRATGHDFPAELSEAERESLLEYLKSL